MRLITLATLLALASPSVWAGAYQDLRPLVGVYDGHRVIGDTLVSCRVEMKETQENGSPAIETTATFDQSLGQIHTISTTLSDLSTTESATKSSLRYEQKNGWGFYSLFVLNARGELTAFEMSDYGSQGECVSLHREAPAVEASHFDAAAELFLEDGTLSHASSNRPNLICETAISADSVRNLGEKPVSVTCRHNDPHPTRPNFEGGYSIFLWNLWNRSKASVAHDFNDLTAQCSGPDLSQLTCVFSPKPKERSSGGVSFGAGSCDIGQHRESYIGDCVPDTNGSGG